MSIDYSDSKITCDNNGLHIRGYYFPWGTKHIPYDKIRSIQRFKMGPFTGQGRIWGTANPHFWVNLDLSRPRKEIGLIVNIGKYVQPIITPDDPTTAESVICERAHLEAGNETLPRGPII